MAMVETILLRLLAVVVSGTLARITRIALPLVQIVLGAAIVLITGESVKLHPELFFLLFLPPLLFLDGWRIPKEDLVRDRIFILELALGLVIFTVLGVGMLIYWMIPAVPMGVAFALAAILSPTDPIAVAAIAKRAPIPKRIMHVLEGESLLNDASGLVCMKFAVAAVLTGVFSLPSAIATFTWLALAGAAIGVGVTLAVHVLKRFVISRWGEDTGAQIIISLLIPFGAYIAAEHLHASGILAAVAAGVTMSFTERSAQALAVTRIRRTVLNGLELPPEPSFLEQEDRARIAAATAAMHAIENAQHLMAKGNPDIDLTAEAASRLMEVYRARIEVRGPGMAESVERARQSAIENRLRVAGLKAERKEILRLTRLHQLDEDASRKLVREIDLQEARYA